MCLASFAEQTQPAAPDLFIKEVYRRMSLRSPSSEEAHYLTLQNFLNQDSAVIATHTYKQILPKNKNARILDIGFGTGWFMAACVKMGYNNIYGADFFGKEKTKNILESCSSIKDVFNIDDNIGDFLSKIDMKFDFIHMSHVIEHIPKYSLLYIVDALYKSLEKEGILLLRTPNMEGPAANSSYYVTLTHEYGFSPRNIRSLLHISGFEEIQFHRFNKSRSIKQLIGNALRIPFLLNSKIKNRLFGVGNNKSYDAELIISSRKKEFPELFNEKFK